jgi:hypothetical protein
LPSPSPTPPPIPRQRRQTNKPKARKHVLQQHDENTENTFSSKRTHF